MTVCCCGNRVCLLCFMLQLNMNCVSVVAVPYVHADADHLESGEVTCDLCAGVLS